MSSKNYAGMLGALATGLMVLFGSVAMAQSDVGRVRNIDIAPALQTKLEKDYGVREAAVLMADLQNAVERSLKRAGASKVAFVDLTLEDAKPNKPTFRQLTRSTSLSYSASIAIGGAKVDAKLFDSSGALIGTVSHEYYSGSLEDVTSQYSWADADRAFSGVARKIRKEAERIG
jgi:hypothetical protein